MSRASRAPLPAPSLGCSHGYPRLVDEAGNLIRAAIRRELGNRHKGPGAAVFSHTLALLFAKARLQRRWAQADSAERAKDRERAAAARTGQEAEAAEIARRHNHNTALLRFQRDRYAFGSLAHSWRAPQLRALYGRALEIAIERASQPRTSSAELHMSITFKPEETRVEPKTEARTIVELIRAQNRSGALLVEDADAVALLAAALRVAEQRGVIAGINRLGAAAKQAGALS